MGQQQKSFGQIFLIPESVKFLFTCAVENGILLVTVSAHWLMSVSPVIHRMLNTEMREKQQRRITLNDLGVDMEHFMEFVEAISIAALHNPILPNPENVMVLLKLADFFQVDWLIKRCDLHLISCVEIPLIDRFLLIDNANETEDQIRNEIYICGDGWLGVFHLLPPAQLGLQIALLSRRFDCLVDEHFKTRRWALGFVHIGHKIGANGTTVLTIKNSWSKTLQMPDKALPNKVIGFKSIMIILWIKY
ncbi:hypothetical protein niasHT_008303 [Heterodera trifolii]|uniref:BTB domain-containing protein n=1 Tax=Heterodera trifolii TaxID=157864 RepID=A0ABD2M1E3_9BILA